MVCQWCFKYSKEVLPFLRHLRGCPMRGEEGLGIPPGERIYTREGYSLYEIDGEEHKVCRLLMNIIERERGDIELVTVALLIQT